MGVSVREKPPGSGVWWVFVRHNYRRVSQRVGNKEAADKVAAGLELKIALNDLGFMDDKKDKRTPTLKEYVNGWEEGGKVHVGWLENAKLSLKNSTRLGYRQILKHDLIPDFGALCLDEITEDAISDFIYKKIREGKRSQTVKNFKNCLSAVLQSAYRPDRYIESNPCRGIEVPTPEDERPSRDINPFTWEERTILENIFKKHYPDYYPLVVCGFRAGLRMGELIALQIGDIDFHQRVIIVQRNITRGKKTTPKTVAGKRKVRMTSQLVEILQEHRKRAKEEKLKHPDWKDVPEWVFFNFDGGYIAYSTFVHKIWNKAMEKTKLARRTPHDMRHTYATLRLSKGDPLPEVSKEMGHSTTAITYRTYYKFLPQSSTTNIDDLDNSVAPCGTLLAPKNKKRSRKS